MRKGEQFLLAIFFTAWCRSSSALSYSVCDEVREEYISDSPQLRGSWPYYNLLYTCTGNLNLEGFSVDACVVNGSRCGQAAADAFCRYLGFDYNSPGLYSTIQATAPALSMTGEWCMSPGNYAQLGHPTRTEFQALQKATSAPYCSSLDSVACIRSRATLQKSAGEVTRLAALAPASAPSPGTTPLQVSPGWSYIMAQPPTVSTAGRKMQTAQV